jgi:hypothetical protein
MPEPVATELQVTKSTANIEPAASNEQPGSTDVYVAEASLWDRAYDQLRKEDQELVNKYELILSKELEDRKCTPVYEPVSSRGTIQTRGKSYAPL